jgi:uncharacterized protein
MGKLEKIRLPVLQAGSPPSPEVPLALAESMFLPPDVPAFDHAASRTGEERQLRTSSYVIWISLPANDEDVLLIHGYTGAYDRVAKRVADYLRGLEVGKRAKPLHGEWSPEPRPSAVPPPSADTLERLRKRGYLTRLSVEEEESLFTKFAAQRHFSAVRSTPNYIVMPTYECNLRCPYCFQDHMRTDASYRHLLRTMDVAMADRILQGMETIEIAHGLAPEGPRTRNVTFFGGEPLLEQSLGIVRHFVDRLLERGKANISAVSNGTELEAYRDLLGPDKIAFLQITIDGPPAVHDQRRIYADGSGSFERIARNIDLALDRGVKISVRMNIDRSNFQLLPAIADEFRARGWTGRAGFSSYVAPVHMAGDPESKHKSFNSWQLSRALIELQQQHASTRQIGGPDDGTVARVRQIFDRRSSPLPSFKADFCGAHTTMYIFDAFGDIYACWERTGDASVRIGSVTETGEVLMSSARMEAWRSRSVTSNPVCRKCRYATYCGGGCAILAEGEHGDIHANHCDGFAQRFRRSAATAFTEHLAGAVSERNADRVCDL